MKKLLLILILGLCYSMSLFAGLSNTHWKAIAIAIADDGDDDNRGEFEAAKQAFLNIKLDKPAKEAATVIQNKWGTHFGNEATIGSKTDKGTLMSLPRYPTMSADEIHNAAIDLIEKPTINTFLTNEGFKIEVPAKRTT